MAATLYFLLGLAAIVAAVYGLAGPWWALLVAGVLLVALGVLTERGSTPAGTATEARS